MILAFCIKKDSSKTIYKIILNKPPTLLASKAKTSNQINTLSTFFFVFFFIY